MAWAFAVNEKSLLMASQTPRGDGRDTQLQDDTTRPDSHGVPSDISGGRPAIVQADERREIGGEW
jgi:hypothetical protein